MTQAGRPGLIDFTVERQRHARFVGRQDVLAQLDRWLLSTQEPGWVVVTGGPGMGKSATLSAWLARREAAGSVVPHHFVRRQVADWDQPGVIAASLSTQLEAKFPDLSDPKASAERRLIELLGRISKRYGDSGDLIVLVDGLDETDAELGVNPLPRFLPHHIPAGIRFLCATRPTYPHLGWLDARNSVRRLNLDDEQWAGSNENAVSGFWQSVAPEYKPPLSQELLAAATERAEGNVLHAVMLHDTLRSSPEAERKVDRLPRGLKALIGDIWDKAISLPSVRLGLGVLCAAQESLPLEVISEVAEWSPDHRDQFLPAARQLLLEEPASWAGTEAYRPRHEWVRELMVERLGASALRIYHSMLAQKLATWPAPQEATAQRYALRYGLTHRLEAGDGAAAWRLAADLGFLEAKCRLCGVHDAETDVARAAARCRDHDDTALHTRLLDLARALALESHWLRAAPEAATALVWNRLRQLGWSEKELDHQLQVPNGVAFVRLRHLATRESPALVRTLIGHTDGVNACAVTPDGRRVVSASSDHTLRVWDLESGHTLATLAGHGNSVTACTTTPDGRHVISASWDHTLKVWDVESGRMLATLHGHDSCVHSCTVTPDGKFVISASADMTLKIWDIDLRQIVRTLKGHSHGVTACAVTTDGTTIISSSRDHTIRIWDLDTGHLRLVLHGHTGGVLSCAATSDGHHVISTSEDHTVRVWNLRSGRTVATLNGHANRVNACAVTLDCGHVITASDDRTLTFQDLRSGQIYASLAGHASGVTSCAVTSDGKRAISASGDRTLKVWRLDIDGFTEFNQSHDNWVNACTMLDRRRVVTASSDRTLKVWDLDSYNLLATLRGHTHWVTACTSPMHGFAVSASTDQTLKVWDLESYSLSTTLSGHTDDVTSCGTTMDGQRVISASSDGTLKIWDRITGFLEATIYCHDGGLTACAVSPDGTVMVSASRDRALHVWDMGTRSLRSTLEGHTGRVNACAVTPDSRLIVSASSDKTLKVWSLDSGRPQATLRGHTDSVHSCAVTPDARYVVSASSDHTLKIWNLQSGVCLFTHRANASFRAVAASLSSIVAGDAAGAVWFLDWKSPEGRASFDLLHEAPSLDSVRLDPATPMPKMKHTILFLAANPLGTDRIALDREARAIQIELERSGFRDCFELVTRWAAEPLDLLRELRKLRPTIVHFSGHGGQDFRGSPIHVMTGRRDLSPLVAPHEQDPKYGLYFQGPAGLPQFVSSQALEDTFGAAGSSVQLVVLNACYSDEHAQALLPHVGCVVGMLGSIVDAAARNFAIGFYGGLGERESIAAAYKQGCAAISLQGLPDRDRPQLAVRPGLDATKLVLAAAQ